MDNQPQKPGDNYLPNQNSTEQPQSNNQEIPQPQPIAQPQVIQPQTATPVASASTSQAPQVFSHQNDKPPSKKGIFAAIIVVLVIIIACAVAYLLFHKSSAPKASTSTASSSSQTLATNLVNKDNTERGNDIQLISAVIQEYATNNQNTLPQNTNSPGNAGTLQLCGAGCTQGTTDVATVNLMYYKDYNVVFEDYSSNLTVKNADTVYIVDNATCKTSSSIGGKTTSQTAAIVYGLQQDANISNVQQKCEEASIT